MNILISNDDGYYSEGIAVLKRVAEKYANVRVVAPDRERSAASNSLTLDRPLSIKEISPGVHSVTGTPTDCVYLALNIMEDFKPDFVFSGVNHGSNLGDDTLYSGTVAAAMEGYMLGIRSIAFSLSDKTDLDWQVTESFLEKFIPHVLSMSFSVPFLWNVNFPKAKPGEVKGFKVTKLGRRHREKLVVPTENPYGMPMYWIGALGPNPQEKDDTDFYWNREGYITLTPLNYDLTSFVEMGQASDLVKDFARNFEA